MSQEDPSSREYTVMLNIERLESLREEMDEAGFSTFDQVEAALSLTQGEAAADGANDLVSSRALLQEILDELLELGLTSYAEVNDQIGTLHRQLDELEGFEGV